MAQVQIYDSSSPDFDAKFETLMAQADEADDTVEARVRDIIACVPDAWQQRLGIGYRQFEMLRSQTIDERNRAVQIRRMNEGTSTAE